LRNLFRPTLLADNIWEIVLEDLTARGIRGLILDLDNTLVDWNESFLRPEVEVWLAKARAVGMRLCLASNAVRGGRVARVAEKLDLPAVIRAGKPFPVAFRKAMAALETEPASTCAIGDQVFTDMLGANWLGLTTVLVKPLSPKESPHTRVIRLIERPLRRRWALQLKAELQTKDSDQKSAR
jgi:HAD superfamily phosphatase (TIGR01668 family)